MNKTSNRYDGIVKAALEQYAVDFEKAEFCCEATNVFYKAYGRDEQVYGLKICSEEANRLEDNLCEVFFLSQLKGNVDFLIPEVVLNKKGKAVTLAQNGGLGEQNRTILYKWVEGTEFEGRETKELFFTLGKILAKLHKAAKGFSIPESMNPKRWDRVFYFTDEKVVFAEEPFRKRLGEQNTELLLKAVIFADKKLSESIKDQKCLLLHGDINPWNILLCGESIGIIDFEDSIVGYPLQDIAILLYYYRYNENYEAYKQSLFNGYKSEAPDFEPDDNEIEILMLARRLNFINFSLLVDEEPWEYVDGCLKRVVEFFKEHKGALI